MKNKWVYYGIGGFLLYKIFTPGKADASTQGTTPPPAKPPSPATYIPTSTEVKMGKVIQAVWRQEFAEPTLQVGIGQESNVTWAYGYVGSELALSGPIMESYTDAVTIWKDAAPDIAAKIETTYGGKLQTV